MSLTVQRDQEQELIIEKISKLLKKEDWEVKSIFPYFHKNRTTVQVIIRKNYNINKKKVIETEEEEQEAIDIVEDYRKNRGEYEGKEAEPDEYEDVRRFLKGEQSHEYEAIQKLIAEFLVKRKKIAQHFYEFGREGFEDFELEWEKWEGRAKK